MTLPASGPLSIGAPFGSNDITVEFGIARDTPFPTGFYGLGGAPSSGPLGFHDFYGRSRNKIEAVPLFVNISGFTQYGESDITVTGGTIVSWALISGIESTRVSKPTIGGTTGVLSVSTPAAGNGTINNTYRITDSNGNTVDIGIQANWGIA